MVDWDLHPHHSDSGVKEVVGETEEDYCTDETEDWDDIHVITSK